MAIVKLSKEAIKNSLEGCKQVFDVTLAGLTPEGIELLANVLFGDLNAELEAQKERERIEQVNRSIYPGK